MPTAPWKQTVLNTFKGIGLDVRRSDSWIPMHVFWAQKFHYMALMYEQILNLPGDVVECGVGKGRSLFMLAYLLSSDAQHPSRLLWGFDSFVGFPEPTTEDASPRNPKAGGWGDTSMKRVKHLMSSMGIEDAFLEERVRLVPGFFEDTLRTFPDRDIALLHIDVDLYRSYINVLDTLFPKVVPGGCILFDEYEDTDWPGAKTAVDEFFAEHGQTVQQHRFSKKYYVVKQ